MRGLLVALLVAAAAAAQDFAPRQPSPKARNIVFLWKHKDFECLFHVPKTYRAKRGAILLMMFYGKDGRVFSEIQRLSRSPAFQDVLLLHPGTLKQESFNRKRGTIDYGPDEVLAGLCHELQTEFGKRVKVNGTYVVGAGKGGAFALYYAARYPKDVQGVMAEMPPYWRDAVPSGDQVGQALLVTRATCTGGGYFQCEPYRDFDRVAKRLRKAGLPRLRLSVLHVLADNMPAPDRKDLFATAGRREQLAWCELMTSRDPAQLRTALDQACAIVQPEAFDFAALYRAAVRVLSIRGAPKSVHDRARRVRGGIQGLAVKHVQAIRASAGKNERLEFDGRAWVGHLPAFLDGFRGVPACDSLAQEWRLKLKRHGKAARARTTRLGSSKPIAAFSAAADIVRHGCLDPSLYTSPYAERLITWRRKADKLRLRKPDVATYDDYVKARRGGLAAYEALNAKYKP